MRLRVGKTYGPRYFTYWNPVNRRSRPKKSGSLCDGVHPGSSKSTAFSCSDWPSSRMPIHAVAATLCFRSENLALTGRALLTCLGRREGGRSSTYSLTRNAFRAALRLSLEPFLSRALRDPGGVESFEGGGRGGEVDGPECIGVDSTARVDVNAARSSSVESGSARSSASSASAADATAVAMSKAAFAAMASPSHGEKPRPERVCNKICFNIRHGVRVTTYHAKIVN